LPVKASDFLKKNDSKKFGWNFNPPLSLRPAFEKKHKFFEIKARVFSDNSPMNTEKKLQKNFQKKLVEIK